MDIKEDTSDNDSTNHQIVQVIEDKMVPKNLFVTVLTVVTLIATVAAARLPQLISGDDELPLARIPYQASILLGGDFLCAGVIISNQHILTTANCVVSIEDPKALIVFVGTSHMDRDGPQYSVGSVVTYPDYDFTDGYSPDIAIIVLDAIISFDENTTSIPFSSGSLTGDKRVNISGWGSFSHNDFVVEKLRSIEVVALTGDKCRSFVEEDNILWNNQICGYSSDGKHACNGNEGGPVTYNGQLVAIISRKNACGDDEGVDYYINVYQYKKWINEIIGTISSVLSD